MLRQLLLRASDSELLRRELTTRKIPRDLALRYIAGETLDDGLALATALARQGRTVTLDYLGESVTEERAARAAADTYLEALERIRADALPCGVSVKPTQMGLAFSPALCGELLGRIVEAAARVGGGDGGEEGAHVTLDMEGSDVTEATVALVEQLWAQGHRNVGCAVQTYLHRTPADIARLSALEPGGASLRLCKGAYAEPPEVAYQRKAEVDAAFVSCAQRLLREGRYPRFATHDDQIIDRIRNDVAREGGGIEEFEFQMLYGVRSSLQDTIVRDGYRLRVYVPFGSEWYPYFVRRLGERPANLIFFLRSLRDT